ncbi:hypothetical protein [Bradyrhizobium sp. dw_78]|uniref:hypothetical protein n=1 Tax=Bradyrhizobium sp. dw_78 TaxID=2719793 RepID=UPI00201C4997|nr:hypothetical protein [Bradyrhizobium sp. dw_78]
MALSMRDATLRMMIAVTACSTSPTFALDPRYPDWPCQQLKVPGISIANVWTGPSVQTFDASQPMDTKEAELIARLAARRTPIEEAKKLIADFVTGTREEKQEKAKALFSGLYSILNAQRDQVMDGIERFSRKQKAMAADIREQAQKLRAMQEKTADDPAQNEESANRLAWQTRIFEDRRKATSYVCDVPVLIEKRLFDLSGAIQNAMNDGSSGN